MTLSAGAFPIDAGQQSIDAYREADRALYRAKMEGRARLVAARPGSTFLSA